MTVLDGWGELAGSPLGTLKQFEDLRCEHCGERIFDVWSKWLEMAGRLEDGTYFFLADHLLHHDIFGLYLLGQDGWVTTVTGLRADRAWVLIRRQGRPDPGETEVDP